MLLTKIILSTLICSLIYANFAFSACDNERAENTAFTKIGEYSKYCKFQIISD